MPKKLGVLNRKALARKLITVISTYASNIDLTQLILPIQRKTVKCRTTKRFNRDRGSMVT